jgi:hypothetical protein
MENVCLGNSGPDWVVNSVGFAVRSHHGVGVWPAPVQRRLKRGGETISVGARRGTPKWQSTLVSSVRVTRSFVGPKRMARELSGRIKVARGHDGRAVRRKRPAVVRVKATGEQLIAMVRKTTSPRGEPTTRSRAVWDAA